MCDKNYKFCENQNAKIEDETNKKSTQNNKRTTNQTYCDDQFIFNQPLSCNHPSIDENSTLHLPNQKVNFHNQSSTLKFPPSFNLRANQKSTPKKQCRVCENICLENVGQTNTVPIHSSLKKSKQTVDSGIETETRVEIHNNNDSDNDTFHSL